MIVYHPSHFWLLVLILGTGLAGLGQSTWADVEGIEVTVRKRSEKLVTTPVAADVILADEIDAWTVRDVSDVAAFSASLILNQGLAPPDIRLSIRGLGTYIGHPTVAQLVDGINYSSEALSFVGASTLAAYHFPDIERVEVIKGPQTVFYGPSAFAGAVQYVTKNPSRTFQGSVRVEVGGDGHRDLQGTVSGPVLEDQFYLRLTGAYWDNDGFYDNEITGGKIGGEDGFGFALTSLIKPIIGLADKFRIEFTQNDLEPTAQVFVPFNTVLPVSQVAIDAGIVEVNPNLNSLTGNGISPLTGLPWYTDTAAAFVTGTIPDGDQLPVRLSPDFLSTGGQAPAPDFPGTEQQIWRVSNTLDWEVDVGTLTSRTGLMKADVSAFYDNDRTAIPGNDPGSDLSFASDIIDNEIETTQLSQELSFSSNFAGQFQFRLGGLWWYEDVEMVDSNHSIIAGGVKCNFRPSRVDPITGCPGFTSVPVSNFVAGVHAARESTKTERTLSHWSIFGSAQWQISNDWRLTADARYVDENLELTGPDTLFPLTAGTGIVTVCGPNGDCGPLPASPGPAGTELASYDLKGFASFDTVPLKFDRKDSYWASKATLDWSPNDVTLIYASISKTENPGGFNSTTIDTFGIDRDHDGLPLDLEFAEERMFVYELGAKRKWPGANLFVSGTLFYQDIKDKLVDGNRTASGIVEFRNLILPRSAEIWGAELAADWKATDNLSLYVSYTYLQSEFDDYRTLSASDRQIAAAGNCTIATSAAGLTVCSIDKSGNELNNVPDHSLIADIQYTQPLANDIDWFVKGLVRFTGERFVDNTNISKLDSFWITDLLAGFESERWQVLFYLNNLFDDDTVQSAVSTLGLGCCRDWRAGLMFPELVFAPRIPEATFATLPNPRTFGVRVTLGF